MMTMTGLGPKSATQKRVKQQQLFDGTPKWKFDTEMLFFFKERTNLWNKGLISADRSNKATLLLTIPRSLFKSSAKDFPLVIYVLLELKDGHSCFQI